MEAILATHDKLKLILRVLFFSRNYQIRVRILEGTRRHSLTKQSTLCDVTPGFSENLIKWRLRKERRNSILMTRHCRDLGSVLIGWKFASTNQKHYPDLGSDLSLVWNFCARFSDVIRGETCGGVAKCRMFSQVIDSTEWPTYQHDRELDGPWALSITLGNEVSKVIDVNIKLRKVIFATHNFS